ncbi:MAG: hypothetical protein EXQ47_08630 [Bryobacterales bacterium]|nr:hypothetical protein [Bryobacterales bacterium]
MSEFFHWLQSMALATFLRESGLTYPIIMSTHLAGIGLFGGLILMTDLRLLGLVLRSSTITEVVTQFRVWKRLGIVVVAGCGVLLAWSKAEQYSTNPYFLTKMVLLVLVIVHAQVFRKSVYANTEELDRAPEVPSHAKWAAVLSLLLWVGLVSAGRLIGYYEPPRT